MTDVNKINKGHFQVNYVSLGVSIVSTLTKSKSRQLRKPRQFQEACLNDREVSIKIEKSWFCLENHLPVPKVLIEIEKSVETWTFWQILTVCLDLDQESVNLIIFIDQDFSICQDFWAWSHSKSLENVEISW